MVSSKNIANEPVSQIKENLKNNDFAFDYANYALDKYIFAFKIYNLLFFTAPLALGVAKFFKILLQQVRVVQQKIANYKF